MIPLAMHEEKVNTLHTDLSKVRGKNKELSDKLTSVEKELADLRLEKKKSVAFDAAKAALGEDYEVPDEKLPKVKAFLAELQDSETLDTKVAEFLDLVKAPKVKQKFSSPYSGTPTNQYENRSSFTPGRKLTPIEAGQLPPDEFEAYIRSIRGGR